MATRRFALTESYSHVSHWIRVGERYEYSIERNTDEKHGSYLVWVGDIDHYRVISVFEDSAAQVGGMRSNAAYRPYIEYTYIDASIPPEVGITGPKDIVIDGDANNAFAWTYYQIVGAPQTHVDIQYEYAGAWRTILNKQARAEQTYIVPAGTMQPGLTRWRVRAYCNSGNTVSAWAVASVTVKARPGVPAIVGSIPFPRPTLSWTSSLQAGYRIRVTVPGLSAEVFDTGPVYSTSKFWKCPKYLEDGGYTFSLQVVNTDNSWSEAVEVRMDIKNVPGEPVRLTVTPTKDYGAALAWETDGVADGFLIYRDGKAIRQTQKKSFTDYQSIGKVSYMVRAVHGEYYTDSNTAFTTVMVDWAVISEADTPSWLRLGVRRDGRPVHGINMAPDVTYLQHEGDSRPTKYSGDDGYVNATHSHGFSLLGRAGYLKLKDMLNKTVVYKDRRGEVTVGNLDSLAVTVDAGFHVEFKITETQIHDEVPHG